MNPVLLSDVLGRGKPRGSAKVILRHLIDRFPAPVSMDELVDAVYGHEEAGGPLYADRNIQITICRLRRRLAAGWHINLLWGWGYELSRSERPRSDYLDPGHAIGTTDSWKYTANRRAA